MSNTHHHDRKRHKVNGRHWPYDYGSAPGHWVRQMMTKPARRAAHLLESTLRNRPLHLFRPYECGAPNCAGCEVERIEAVDQFPEVDPVYWPHARKPHVYYW